MKCYVSLVMLLALPVLVRTQLTAYLVQNTLVYLIIRRVYAYLVISLTKQFRNVQSVFLVIVSAAKRRIALNVLLDSGLMMITSVFYKMDMALMQL